VIALIMLAVGCAGAGLGIVFGYTKGWEAGHSDGVRDAVDPSTNPYNSMMKTGQIKGPATVYAPEPKLDYDTEMRKIHKHYSMDPCTKECFAAVAELQRKIRGY
jgi:hypothetical protein